MNLLKVFLFLNVLFINDAFGISAWETVQNGMGALANGISGTIIENPISLPIGTYYALCHPQLIKDNPLFSALWGTSIMCSFVRNTFAIKFSKNFIVKTVLENPFFVFFAAHTYIYNRNSIKTHPWISMFIGGSIAYSLAKNYRACQGVNNISKPQKNSETVPTAPAYENFFDEDEMQ